MPHQTLGWVNTSEIALKIVPRNRLEASLNIQDRDIGFVKVGMPATISVDSFPSGEFGYITGEVKSLGLDALPPSQEARPTASRPALALISRRFWLVTTSSTFRVAWP